MLTTRNIRDRFIDKFKDQDFEDDDEELENSDDADDLLDPSEEEDFDISDLDEESGDPTYGAVPTVSSPDFHTNY